MSDIFQYLEALQTVQSHIRDKFYWAISKTEGGDRFLTKSKLLINLAVKGFKFKKSKF